MSLAKINDNELDWPELEKLKLDIENLVGNSVELFQKATFDYIFILPNDVGNRLLEVSDLINSLLSELRSEPGSVVRIQVRVANKMTYFEFYEKLNQLREDISYQTSKVIERIEPSGNPMKVVVLTICLSRLDEIKGKLEQYYTINRNEFKFIPIAIIDNTKNQINSLEEEIRKVENEDVELGINKIQNLVQKLDNLEKYVTESKKN